MTPATFGHAAPIRKLSTSDAPGTPVSAVHRGRVVTAPLVGFDEAGRVMLSTYPVLHIELGLCHVEVAA